MALEGSLGTVPLPDVLQLLGSTGKTGVLHLRRELNWSRIYLRDGMVLAASSSSPEDYVGDTLASLGQVSEAELRQALARQQREGKLVGLILVEEGKLDREVLRGYLADRAYELLAKLLDWPEGQFRFEEYALPAFELVPLEVSVELLLLEAFRRQDELKRLRELVPSEDMILQAAEAPPLEAGPSSQPLAAALLRKLAAPHSLRDLRLAFRISEFALLEQIAALLERGAIRCNPGQEARSGSVDWLKRARELLAAGDSERAVIELRANLAKRPPSDEALRLLAQADACFQRDVTERELPLSARPLVERPLTELLESSLSPTEAFLISRLEQDASIAALIESTPLPVSEILLSLKRLIANGYVRLAS